MGLAHKLYKIGSLLSDDDVKAMIKSSNFKDSDHITLAIDFKIENGRLLSAPKLSRTSLDTIKTFFTKKIGGTKYNLSEEFPALTLRPTAIKSAVDELLWIWQRKSNNIKDLNSRDRKAHV